MSIEDFRDVDLPLPARLDAARQVIRKLEEALAAARAEVVDVVQAAPRDDDLTAALYWEYEDLVPAALLGQHHLMRDLLEERCPWTYPCPSCGLDQRLTSRTALKELQRAAAAGKDRAYKLRGYRCSTCRAVEQELDQQRWREREQRHAQRLRELKTMRYRDYLLTPEWQERRLARLKAARYACQVCNGRNKVLNVHHRTYVRRGDEYARDLIVLCEDCHHMFHRNGSLAPHDRDED